MVRNQSIEALTHYKAKCKTRTAEAPHASSKPRQVFSHKLSKHPMQDLIGAAIQLRHQRSRG
jgi:hypothetical protein